MIPLFKVYMSEKASTEASKIINSGFIGQGPIVDKFEDALKKRFRHEHIVTTNSATSAEHLAIRMLKNSDVINKMYMELLFMIPYGLVLKKQMKHYVLH